MRPKVYLISVGMGNPDTLTNRALKAIEKSQVLLGAKRLLDMFEQKKSFPMILSSEITEFIKESSYDIYGVLLSGDVGFYSGAAALRETLDFCDVESIPGISSLNFFCAKLGISWQDLNIVSVHGRECNFIGEIQSHKKTFLLTGGKITVEEVCQKMCDNGLGDLKVSVGENLSYPNEKIITSTAKELNSKMFDNLSVMIIENQAPILGRSFIPDDEFMRGKVPMTKEEIRTLLVSKLKLKKDSVVWDVGAGTGSISVEMAFAANYGSVYAIERKPEAVELINKNKTKFRLNNLNIIEGSAPIVLEELPKPDRVFVGGSTGQLSQILGCAINKNPKVRFVITAVTLETLSLALENMKSSNVKNTDIAQVSVTRTNKVGDYNMMSALTPVWIISGEGSG